MASLNKIMLIGNVGKTPEFHSFDNGGQVANFSLGVNESYTDRNGQRQENSQWFNVVVNGNLVSVVQNYVQKGTSLYVEGKLRTREFVGNDGQKRYTTEVVALSLQLLGSRPQQSAPQQGYQQQTAPQPQPQNYGYQQAAPAPQQQRNIYRQQPQQQPAPQPAPMMDANDDLPF